MVQLLRTNPENNDFLELVKLLDDDLAIRDGDDHSFYSQFNKIDAIKFVVLAYENQKPVGCGAIREYSPGIMEIKRMFVLPETRGKGIASTILAELEEWAIELYVRSASWKQERCSRKLLECIGRMGTNRFPITGCISA